MFKKMIGLATAIALTATLFTGCGQQNQTPNVSTPNDTSSSGSQQPSAGSFPENGELTFVIPYSDSSGTNGVWRAFGAEHHLLPEPAPRRHIHPLFFGGHHHVQGQQPDRCGL